MTISSNSQGNDTNFEFSNQNYPNVKLHFHINGKLTAKEAQSAQAITQIANELFKSEPSIIKRLKTEKTFHFEVNKNLFSESSQKASSQKSNESTQKSEPHTPYHQLLAQVRNQLNFFKSTTIEAPTITSEPTLESRISKAALPTILDIKQEKEKASSTPLETTLTAKSISITSEPAKDKTDIKKIAGHFLGDKFLAKTGLESYEPIDILLLIADYIKSKAAYTQKSSPQTETLQTILNKIETGLKVQESLSKEEQTIEEIINSSTKIREAISDLKPGEGMILGGGWNGEPSGHAIYYDITRQADKSFMLTLFNTGAGTEYHRQARFYTSTSGSHSPKLITKVNPCLQIGNITEENMLSPSFWQAAVEMNSLSKQPYKTIGNPNEQRALTQYTPENFYTNLIPSLGGDIIPQEITNFDKYVIPQSSGTCSVQGMMALLHQYLPDAIYTDLEFDLKLKVFKKLYEAYKNVNDLKSDAQARALLLKSSEHLAVYLKESLTKNSITPESSLEAAALIKKVQLLVTQAKTTAIFDNHKQPELNLEGTYKTEFSTEGTKVVPPEVVIVDKTPEETIPIPVNWEPSVATISNDLKKFSDFFAQNYVKFPYETTDSIKNLLLKLPLPNHTFDSFWLKIDPSQTLSCMESIQSLTETLNKICSSQMTDSFSEVRKELIIALYSANAIQHQLASQSKELQALGFDTWNFYPIDLAQCFGFVKGKINGDSEIYDAFIKQKIINILEYFSIQKTDISKIEFFNFTSYKTTEAQFITEADPKLNRNENDFALKYYLENEDKFTKLFPDIESDKNYIKSELSLDKFESGYFPKAFYLLRKQALIANLYLHAIDYVEPPTAKIGPDGIQPVYTNLPYRREEVFPILVGEDNWEHATDFSSTTFDFANQFETTIPLRPDESESKDLSSDALSEVINYRSIWNKGTKEAGFIHQEVSIIKAIDYFSTNFQKLKDNEVQFFLRKILFNKNDLKILLENHPTYLNRLNQFLQQGFEYNKITKNINGMVFFIYMHQMMLSELRADSGQRFQTSIERLQKSGIESKSSSIENTLNSLLTICNTLEEKYLVHRQLVYEYAQMSEKEQSTKLPQISSSLAFLNLYSFNEFANAHLSGTLIEFRLKISSAFLEAKYIQPQLNEVLYAISKAIDVKIPPKLDIKWRGSPPTYIGSIKGVDTYSLDYTNFSLRIEGNTIVLIPQSILAHQTFKDNFPDNKNIMATLKSADIYEFADTQGLLVQIKSAKEHITLFRQFEKNGPFYHFKNPGNCKQLLTSSHLENFAIWELWSEQHQANSALICEDGSTKISYQLTLTGKETGVLTDNAGLHYVTIKDSPLYQQLERFDHKKNIDLWTNKDGSLAKVDMRTAGLSFTVKSNKHGIKELQSTEFPGYHIAAKQGIRTLESYSNYLVLENDSGKIKVIILRKQLEVYEKGGLSPKIQQEKDYPNDPNPSKKPAFFEYTLNIKQELEAEDAEANLYLGYVLLGLKQYKEAQKIFINSSKKFSAYTDRELLHFDWINTLHHASHDNDPQSSALILTVIGVLLKNRRTYKLNFEKEFGEKLLKTAQEAFRHYLSNLDTVGDLLLAPEVEQLILEELERTNNSLRTFKERLHALTGNVPPTLGHSEELLVKLKIEKRNDLFPDPSPLTKNVRVFLRKMSTISENSSSLITRRNEYNLEHAYNFAKTLKLTEIAENIRKWELINIFNMPRGYKIICGLMVAISLKPDKFPNYKEFSEIIADDSKVESLKTILLTAQQIYEEYKKNQQAKLDPSDSHLHKFFEQQKLKSEMEQKNHIVLPTSPTALKTSADDIILSNQLESSSKILENMFSKQIKQQKDQESGLKEIRVAKAGIQSEITKINASLKFQASEILKIANKNLPLSSILTIDELTNNFANASTADFKFRNSNLSEGNIHEIRKMLPSYISQFNQQQNLDSQNISLASIESNLKAYANESPKDYFQLNGLNDKATLLSKIKSSIDTLDTERISSNEITKKLELEILALANKTSGLDPKALALQTFAVLSKQKSEFTIDDLCMSFINKDNNSFIERNPFLATGDIENLKTLLTSYLIRFTDEQKLVRQMNALRSLTEYIEKQKNDHDLSKDAIFEEMYQKAANSLTATRNFNASQHLPFLIFEALGNVTLRADQVESLNSMSNAKHMIRQMIMGSGKSKVLLPILALMKADGTKLSTIVIPEPLYDTTVQDLNKSMSKSFQKAIHTLSFTRNTEVTLTSVKDLKAYLMAITKKRECLVITSKSLACLSLKYQELLLKFNKDSTEEQLEIILTLQDILNTFSKGNALIDEVDLTLNSRLEVNFTRGKLNPLDENIRVTIGALYQELFHKDFNGSLLTSFSTLAPQYDTVIKPKLIENILQSKQLQPYFKRFSPEVLNIIKAYLSGNYSTPIEKYIDSIPDKNIKNILAILKEQLNNLLPLALSKRFAVDYGLSRKNQGTDQPPRQLAIPYNGNNSPVESSEFSSPELTMNYTIQMYMINGITSKDVFHNVRKMILDSENEIALKGLKGFNAIKNTAGYKRFIECCGDISGIPFDEKFNMADSDKIAERMNKIRLSDPKLFIDYITKNILSEIQVNDEQISSNAIDFAGLFSSVIGFTGTPWNIDTYAEPLREDPKINLATDGQTIDLIYKNSQTSDGIRFLKDNSFPGNISELIRLKDNALIDTGAVFNNHSNENVAKEILNFLITKKSEKNKVIFFQGNTIQILEKSGNEFRISPFNAANYKPDDSFFTYYDQAHATGTDIPQTSFASASITVGKDVTSRDLFQGVWRLRGIENKQTISFVIASEANDKMHSQFNIASEKKITCIDILKFISSNQHEQQITHLIIATKQKIKNVLKNLILKTFAEECQKFGSEKFERKKLIPLMFLDAMQNVLISLQNNAPYDLYGKRETLQNKEAVIEMLKKQVLEQFQAICAKNPVLKQSEKSFLELLQDEMDYSLGATAELLPDKIKSSSVKPNTDSLVENEVQKETQNQTENEMEKLAQSIKQNQEITGIDHMRFETWTPNKPPPEIFSKKEYDVLEVFSSLKLKKNPNLQKFSSLFKDILISPNLMSQDTDLTEFRPLLTQYLLFSREKATGKLQMTLLDSQSDLNFYLIALSKDRKNQYPNIKKREMELCLCNQNGEIIETDSQMNDSFKKSLSSAGEELRIQLKLFNRDIFFSEPDLAVLKTFIKKQPPNLVKDFYNYIYPPKSAMYAAFLNSDLYKVLNPK